MTQQLKLQAKKRLGTGTEVVADAGKVAAVLKKLERDAMQIINDLVALRKECFAPDDKRAKLLLDHLQAPFYDARRKIKESTDELKSLATGVKD